MAFQNFKYRVQDFIGYIEYNKTDEDFDLYHNVGIHKDEFGHIVRVETVLSFRDKNIDKLSKGEIDFFIPKEDTDEEYFDLKFIVTELVYQSYMRQAGHIYSKYSIIPSLLPNVFQLYNEFNTTYTKNHF